MIKCIHNWLVRQEWLWVTKFNVNLHRESRWFDWWHIVLGYETITSENRTNTFKDEVIPQFVK